MRATHRSRISLTASQIYLAALVAFALAATAAAQTPAENLRAFTVRPVVTGYEQWLSADLMKRLAKWGPQQDNMGNIIVTIGSGEPRRLMGAPMDEPGYVVSGITPDGYLRVQRLPQTSPAAHTQFDILHSAQPVVIQTRQGTWVYGVIAGLSTHLQTARRDAPRVNHPDEIYVDIGAASPAEVKRAGVDLLDPIGLDRELMVMANGKLSAPGIGDRFGVAALVDVLGRLDASKVKGTLTIAFTAQQWAPSRGLDRLMQQVKADEVIHVFRMRAGRVPPRGGEPGGTIAPKLMPGGGIVTGKMRPEEPLAEFPAALKAIAEKNSLPFAADQSLPLGPVSYTRGPQLPAKFAHVGIPVAWPFTPAEMIDAKDLDALTDLLLAYVQDSVPPRANPVPAAAAKAPAADRWGPTGPSVEQILSRLVESYGISGYEKAVNETVAGLLPKWAKPETDDAGNLLLTMGKRAAGAKGPRIVFIAHMDEIGYVVTNIAADGRLEVETRGGGIREFFLGHAALVHTAAGVRPGVMELPAGWEAPDFTFTRAGGAAGGAAGEGQRPAPLRVDVGARTAAEVEALGIKKNDWVTIPKKYRKLFGTRANGRSFDDRVGCTALVRAVWDLGQAYAGKEILFVWSTREEVGLDGAKAVADRLAAAGGAPEFVFAVDTFVSSDSPLESQRFADAPIGRGFVIRAVDNSNITDRKYVDKLIGIAHANQIPVQYGVTGGGNDGAVFLRHGTVDIPISWPLRYSHSPGEVIDLRDVAALARITAAIGRAW